MLATIIGLVAAFLAWKQRNIPSAKYLMLLEIVVSEWAFSVIFESSGTTLFLKILWSQISYIGIVSSPVLYFLFALAFSQHYKHLNSKNIFYLSIIPAITLIMVFTNSWHNLHWTKVVINPATNIALYYYGPSFWIFTSYSYILLTLGLFIMTRTLIRFNPRFKSQVFIILLGSVLPFIGNIIYVFNINPIPGLDWTPISFAFSGLVLTIGILQFGLFKLTPVARDKLVEIMRDGIIVLSPDWQVVDVNPAIERVLGKKNSDIIGRPAADVFRKWGDLFEKISTDSNNQSAIQFEAEHDQLYYDIEITPLHNRLGQVTGRMIIVHDITDRKNAEQLVRKNQLLLNATLNSTADGILVVDQAGQVIFNNRRFCELWHIPDNIISSKNDKKLLDFVSDQLSDPDVFISRVNDLYISQREAYDTINFRDGRVFERFTAPLLRDGKIRGRVWSFRDITEQQLLVKMLQSERDRFQTYLDITEVMIVVINIENRVELINNKGCEILGYSHDQIIGKKWIDQFIPARSQKNVTEIFQQIINGEIKSNTYAENLIVNSKGEERIIAWHNALIYGANNQILGTISSGEDVTEKKRGEEEREQALAEAQQANSVKTLFLANMSHEIRTPLNSIIGFTNLLNDKLANSKKEELRSYSSIIQTSSERLMRTIHEILDLSQIEAGAFNFYPAETDLVAIINRSFQQFITTAEEKELQYIFTTKLRHAPVKIDENNIQNALSNLIDNAIKYTNSGQVQLDLVESKHNYLLTISDTGIGISKDYLNKIYDAFSQESSGYTKKYQGLGLGLTITKKYLDLNNVAINVVSTKGEGTVFTLTFPSLSLAD